MFFSSPDKKLQREYRKLIKEAHRLSSINRSESDKRYFEAEQVAQKLVDLKMGK